MTADRRRRSSGALFAVALVTSTLAWAPPATAAAAGPTILHPATGQAVDDDDALRVRIRPVDGASAYLFGFDQDGGTTWEILRDAAALHSGELVVHPETDAHDSVEEGPLDIWVTARVDGRWTDVSHVHITLTEIPSRDDLRHDPDLRAAPLDGDRLGRVVDLARCLPYMAHSPLAAFPRAWAVSPGAAREACRAVAVDIRTDAESLLRCVTVRPSGVCLGLRPA